MKAYDYGFLAAIASTLLLTAGGIVWLSIGSTPAPAVAATSTERSVPAPAAVEPTPPEPIAAAPEWAVMRVHGAVLGSDGLPMAGVRVRPEGELAPETLTGPSGRFEMLLPSEHARPALRFLADGYEDRHVVLERARLAELDVRLEPRRERTVVSGRVTGRGGEAVPGELVELESGQLEAIHTARTDGQGRFFIAEVAVADDYELRIRPQGSYRQLWQFPLRATRSGLDLDLVLEPAPEVRPSSTAFQISRSAGR